MQTTTNLQSLKVLAKTILGRLENQNFIVHDPKKRIELQEKLVKDLSKWILTEEDLTNMVRQEVQSHSDQITDSNITETAAFQSQKRALRQKFSDNQIQGFYLTSTLRDVCKGVRQFLFDTPLVEDVFETDEAIEKMVMDTIQSFDESKIA